MFFALCLLCGRLVLMLQDNRGTCGACPGPAGAVQKRWELPKQNLAFLGWFCEPVIAPSRSSVNRTFFFRSFFVTFFKQTFSSSPPWLRDIFGSPLCTAPQAGARAEYVTHKYLGTHHIDEYKYLVCFPAPPRGEFQKLEAFKQRGRRKAGTEAATWTQ